MCGIAYFKETEMMKTDRMRTGIFILLAVSLCAIVLTTGCTDSLIAPGNSGENLSNFSSLLVNNDPNTVPVGTAYNQTLSTFWSFTIDGPYAANANWTTAALDPEPSVIYDVNGKPLYYEFYLKNTGGIPGYFWTAANKRMGFPVFRIYPGAPSWNYSQIAQAAEKIVKTRYTEYPIQSNIPTLYSGDFLTLCRMLIIRNLCSGASEQVNAFAIEIIPENASDTYKSHTYASSYLDSVPHSEYSDRVRVWEEYTSIANRIVEYAMAQGIDVRLPLSEENASIIRKYHTMLTSDPASFEPFREPAVSAVSRDTDPDDIPAPVAYPQTDTISTTLDNDAAENFTRVALAKINQSGSYTPSREFLEYMNAPALTRQQKESAIRIALTSKKFQGYMNESHGPISFGWAYPYSGMVRLSMTAGSATSRVYGLASVDIDIDRGVLDNESFTDWKKYW